MMPTELRQLDDLLASVLPAAGPGRGVEVGVHCGDTSAHLLRRFERLHLVLVDSWAAYTARHPYRLSEDPFARFSPPEQKACRRATELVTAFAADRRTILPGTSANTAAHWTGEPFDFALIDDDHTYHGVWRSLAWWKHLRPGGLICGPHFWHPLCRRGQWGIQRAVQEFAERERLSFFNRDSLWWISKPG